MRSIAAVIIAWSLLAGGVAGAEDDLSVALEKAQTLVERHRYREVLQLLAGLPPADDPETRYWVAAETGRAHFHLGQYRQAHERFREAVLLQPQRVEAALYLEATSFLLGDREQALEILREVVRSGARDLYLAVTLPGERLFLGDAGVWEALDGGAVPLAVDAAGGTVLGVRLGEDRRSVTKALGNPEPDSTAPVVTARAGPFLVWAFAFTDDGGLAEVMLQVEHLLRYTPYRVRFAGGYDWKLTPADAVAELGSPTAIRDDDGLAMTWVLAESTLTLEFGPPRLPAHPAVDGDRLMLRIVRLQAPEPGGS